jgi:hypothetical protein
VLRCDGFFGAGLTRSVAMFPVCFFEEIPVKKITKSKVNQVQTQRRQLDVGELDRVYGGRVSAEGTKDENAHL